MLASLRFPAMRRQLAMLVLLLASVACSDDGPPDPSEVAGRYRLTSVAGEELPVALDAAAGIYVEFGNLLLSADGQFLGNGLVTVRRDGIVNEAHPFTVVGRYRLHRNGVTLRANDGAEAYFRAEEGWSSLVGPGLPRSGPGVAVLQEHVFQRGHQVWD